MDMKTVIRSGDADALRRLLSENPGRANELISWGDNCIFTHPLHYVSDVLFNGSLQAGTEIPLIEALIGAGADLDFQRDGKGDTPLIGAASLGAEDIGLRLLDAGANPAVRGLFGETALHWAALLGEERLAKRLVASSDVNLRDSKYNSPPLGWALEGWSSPPAGNRGHQREVVLILVSARAHVESQWLNDAQVRRDPEVFAALTR